jgi:hypothetical protein
MTGIAVVGNSVYCENQVEPIDTGRFIMFSVIINTYNNKTKGPTLMELCTATGKRKKFSNN